MQITKIVSDKLDSNVFVVESQGKTFIVDCGADYESVKKVVKGKVCAIFLTHGHYDHALNACEYAKKFGCKIYANQNITEILQDAKKKLWRKFFNSRFFRLCFS